MHIQRVTEGARETSVRGRRHKGLWVVQPFSYFPNPYGDKSSNFPIRLPYKSPASATLSGELGMLVR